MSAMTYNRVDLAQEQLEDALVLFLEQKKYASAISLAGAAEEIFGKELIRRGEQNVQDWKFDQMEVFHKLLHGKELEKRKFNEEENRVRNALKHLDEKDSSEITVDLEQAACWMLVRACENARRLGRPIAGFEQFDQWFYQNIVGI